MNIIGDILLVLAVITNLALAIMLYVKGKHRIANISFAIIVFFLALWTLTIFFYETSSNIGNIILYTKLANISAILILPFFLHFSFVFPFSNKKESRYLIISIIAAIPIIAIVYFLLSTNLHIKEISINPDGGKDIIYGPAYYLYTAYFVLMLLWTFANIIIKHKKATGVNKIQIKYVLFATILVAVFGSILNLALPRFGISKFSWLGPQFTLIMAGIISYAIVKHRLLDIVVIIRKVTILGILLMIILGIFSMVAFGLPFVFADSLPEDTFQITLVAVAFIVALFFQPLRRSIEEFTDRWFFKGAYKPQQVIDELSEKISTIIDLRVLLDATAQILLKAFRSEHAVFSVREKIGRVEKDAESAEQKFIAYNTEGRHRPMEEFTYDSKNPFVRYFNKYAGEVIIRDELRKDLEESGSIKHESRNMKHQVKRSGENIDLRLKQAVLKEMANHEFAIIFPVFSKEELVGIFGLGAKKSGDIYAHQDLQILELFSHQVGIAVENAKLYADLKLFNEKLQFEVEKATQDLRITNSQLNLRNKDLGALQKITNLITRTLDLASITQTIADSISTELGYIGGIIYFYDKEKKELKVQAITQTPLTKKAISLLPKLPFEYVINDADNNVLELCI